MCGICGIAGSFDKGEVAVMARETAHRGPDDQTVTEFEGCGFGFNRLSIIDVAGGRQPISDEKERYWIIYNGEVYNFPELRRELEALGHRFATHTDTETIVHGYEVWGKDVVKHLRGMFAFAIWDTREKELFLARDRLGIKPLYYCDLGKRLAFASEIKALTTLHDFDRTLDYRAIAQVFAQRFSIAPLTPFANVKRLLPGCTLTWKAGRFEIDRYYTYEIEAAAGGSVIGNATELLEALRDTIRRMLVSEVPVGFFLSGGLDSSSVVAIAAEMMQQRLLTFTAVYDAGDPSISEGGPAQLMAEEVGSSHREVEVLRAEVPKVLPFVVRSLDEPLIDPASLSEWILGRGTKPHSTVILVGEGADEQFGGYSNKWRLLRARERAASTGIGKIIRALPTPTPRAPGKLPRAIALLKDLDAPEAFYFDASGLMSRPELEALLKGEALQQGAGEFFEERARLFAATAASNGHTMLDRLLTFDARHNLPANILLKVDKTTMASSIEARVPFLDEVVLGVAGKVPGNQKFTGSVEKMVLRKAVSSYLPGEIAWRPKQAFRTPIGEWVKELAPMAERLLQSEDSMVKELVSRDAISRILQTAGPSNRYDAHQFWAFLTMELWLRQFVRGEGAKALSNA